jgi:amino acid transporter
MAQLVWPDYRTLANPETAFMDVARLAGGYALFAAFGVVLVVSSLACGLAGHVGAARLLYSMGRDDVLPQKVFGYIDAKRSIPIYNVWIVGILAYVGTLTMEWEKAAEILNFGALLTFMGVNLVALRHFGFSRSTAATRNILIDIVVPTLGFSFCLLIFLGLQGSTKLSGGVWLAVGFAYLVFKTRGFRKRPVIIDFKES